MIRQVRRPDERHADTSKEPELDYSDEISSEAIEELQRRADKLLKERSWRLVAGHDFKKPT